MAIQFHFWASARNKQEQVLVQCELRFPLRFTAHTLTITEIETLAVACNGLKCRKGSLNALNAVKAIVIALNAATTLAVVLNSTETLAMVLKGTKALAIVLNAIKTLAIHLMLLKLTYAASNAAKPLQRSYLPCSS